MNCYEVQVLQPAMVGSERERKLSPSGDKDDDDEIRVSHSCYQLLRRLACNGIMQL